MSDRSGLVLSGLTEPSGPSQPPQPQNSDEPSRPVIGFDLDLTLVDTRERITTCFMAAMARLGRPITREAVIPHLGYPITEKVMALAPDLDADEVIRVYRGLYDDPQLPPCPRMPGARRALSDVRAAGARTMVVSAKARHAVIDALRGADLSDLVTDVYGDVFGAAKAAPLIVQRARWYVGDHPGDITAAKKAGVVAIAVATGAHDAPALRDSGADVVLADLTEFPTWWRAEMSAAVD